MLLNDSFIFKFIFLENLWTIYHLKLELNYILRTEAYKDGLLSLTFSLDNLDNRDRISKPIGKLKQRTTLKFLFPNLALKCTIFQVIYLIYKYIYYFHLILDHFYSIQINMKLKVDCFYNFSNVFSFIYNECSVSIVISITIYA